MLPVMIESSSVIPEQNQVLPCPGLYLFQVTQSNCWCTRARKGHFRTHSKQAVKKPAPCPRLGHPAFSVTLAVSSMAQVSWGWHHSCCCCKLIPGGRGGGSLPVPAGNRPGRVRDPFPAGLAPALPGSLPKAALGMPRGWGSRRDSTPSPQTAAPAWDLPQPKLEISHKQHQRHRAPETFVQLTFLQGSSFHFWKNLFPPQRYLLKYLRCDISPTNTGRNFPRQQG